MGLPYVTSANAGKIAQVVSKESLHKLKTVNGESLIGEGNIEIQGGGTIVEANPTITGKEDNLTSIKIGDRDYIIPSGGSVDFDLKKDLYLKTGIYLIDGENDVQIDENTVLIDPNFTHWYEDELLSSFEDTSAFVMYGQVIGLNELDMDDGAQTIPVYAPATLPLLTKEGKDPATISGLVTVYYKLEVGETEGKEPISCYYLVHKEIVQKSFAGDTPTPSEQVVYRAVSTLNDAIRNDFHDYEGIGPYDKIRTYQIAMDTQDFYALAQNSRMIQSFMERSASSPSEYGLSFNIFKTQVWQNNLEVENFPVKIKTRVTPAEVSSQSSSPYIYELIVTDINPDESEVPEDPLPTRFYGTLTLWIYKEGDK